VAIRYATTSMQQSTYINICNAAFVVVQLNCNVNTLLQCQIPVLMLILRFNHVVFAVTCSYSIDSISECVFITLTRCAL
jgi:hypothetical protein